MSNRTCMGMNEMFCIKKLRSWETSRFMYMQFLTYTEVNLLGSNERTETAVISFFNRLVTKAGVANNFLTIYISFNNIIGYFFCNISIRYTVSKVHLTGTVN